MNERIKQLVLEAGFYHYGEDLGFYNIPAPAFYGRMEKFVELIKQAIYDDVKEELIDDAIINEGPDRVSREYLKGCNGGVVDALCHIKNFGLDIEL